MRNRDDDGPLVHFHLGIMSEDDGRKRKTNIKVDAEDIIAAGAVIVALLFTCAMIFGRAPINSYTVGIVGFSGAGAAIAAIAKTRGKRVSRTPWIEWIVIVLLLFGFGAYVWFSRSWIGFS
jgi:uncharacterized RDD family membrane protein YckC